MPSSESYASAVFPNVDFYTSLHNVNFFHEYTHEPVSIMMKADLGSPITKLKKEDAVNLLGILDINKRGNPTGTKGTSGREVGEFYVHELNMQIGNLQPIKVEVMIGPTPRNLLGRNVISKYITTFTKENVEYVEEDNLNKLNPRLTNIQEYPVNPSNFSKVSHPVTFYNIETNEQIPIRMFADTGAYVTTLDEKYMDLLGVDKESADTAVSYDVNDTERIRYREIMFVRIGNLKPFPTEVFFGQTRGINLLGRLAMYQYKVIYTKDLIRYQSYYAAGNKSATNFRDI